ncbi:MAG: nickel pincer cofactor biosynthesis protein LarC [Clostridia bacterium]|nr:nickel pincer cofactor biosynthesis protein LarC [Clostridia bacterium]
MRTLYIECNMGAAGDMLTAALIDLLDNKEEVVAELNSLGIEGVKYELEKTSKCGIYGSHMHVYVNGEEEGEHHHHHHHHDEDAHDHEHHHEHEHHHDGEEHDHEHHHDHEHEHGHEHGHSHHHHSGMHDIEHIVRGHLEISDSIKDSVMAVYGLIAEAESHAHDKPVTEIHFHEVGTMDAIADVTAVCYLLDKLNVDRVVVSPIHVGSGTVKCAHGILPVPAPATAYILKDAPIYGGSIKGELCTPTGAALLKHFASSFGDMPVMKVSAIGYGMGNKDFEVANCVRVILGEEEDKTDRVVELDFNVDDMTAEGLGFAQEMIFAAGAVEVFTTAVGMKKSRPGTLVTVICREVDKAKVVESVFEHTTTIGIREKACQRYVLSREFVTVDTPLGPITKKVSTGYGVRREKYEYEDLARLARENNTSIDEIKKKAGI